MEISAMIKYCFLVIAGLGVFTSFQRSDYNLVLFMFAFSLWDKHPKHKIRFFYLFIFSLLIDIIWAFYWNATWNENTIDNKNTKGAQTFVMTLTVIQILVKAVVIMLCIYSDKTCKQAATPNGFIGHGKEFIGLEKDTTPHQQFSDEKHQQ